MLKSLLIALACLGSGLPAHAAESNPAADLQSLRLLLDVPDAEVDLAQAKIAIDRVIDPAIDAQATFRQIDDWVARTRARFPSGASNRAKLDLLLSSLYEPGPWNDHRPFGYDLDDPMGHDPRTKQLARYLATRKGNCVSMPILFAILGQKLGLRVTLAAAPHHLLVKYLDDGGEWLNVEATSGGFKYDSSYVRLLDISERALESGIYLRPLTPRESLAELLGVLMEHYRTEDFAMAKIATADLALSFDPRNVGALLHAGSGYFLMLKPIERQYPDATDIPPELRAEVRFMQQANLNLFAEAEALGWKEPNSTPEWQAAYLEEIEREKKRIGAGQ